MDVLINNQSVTKCLALNIATILVLAAANGCASKTSGTSYSHTTFAGGSETRNFYEIVTVVDSQDLLTSKMALMRSEIAEILGSRLADKPANGWSGISMERHDVDAWLNGFYRGDKRKEKVYLSVHTVNKTYSVSELGLNEPGELLTKFFDRSGSNPNSWWTMKYVPPGEQLRGADLIATLKEYGFEVARGGDIIPILMARPKSTP